MTRPGCDDVSRYLEKFLDQGPTTGVDLNLLTDHAEACRDCYDRLAEFFRTVELPESSYLRETLDELALALFNFARAVIRDRPSDPDTENVRITLQGGGSADENIAAGREMIEDAEDYVGSSSVGGMDLNEVRELLDHGDSPEVRRTELALGIFERLTTMQSRYTAEAWNWLGVLLYQKERFPAAERAFRHLLALPDGAPAARAFANVNLAWVLKQQNDLSEAIKHAARATVLAEEDGSDPYFGLLAELYFRLLRGDAPDQSHASELLDRIQAEEGGGQRLWDDLHLQSNAGILEAVQSSSLGPRLEAP